MKCPITLWSDMDGVIAVYEPEAYIKTEKEKSKFETPGIHYFNGLEPDYCIIDAYDILQKKDHLPVHIITYVTPDPELLGEHADDKMAWIQKFMPFINTETQFDVIHEPKYQFVQQKLCRKLTKQDILISDYNMDLEPWYAAGGTAVKYLNTLNSRSSFNGPCIECSWTAGQIRQFIIRLTEGTPK